MSDDLERSDVAGGGNRSPELRNYEDLASQLDAFKDRYGEPTRLGYPGSSTDVTPSETFGETDVVYIDVDADAIGYLEDKNYEGIEADANSFDSEDNFDAILLYNQDFEEVASFAERNLTDSGTVICNQYHNAASDLLNQNEYTLDGRFPVQQPQEFDTNAKACFEQVESDEEFRDARPEQFQTNRDLVNQYVGENEGVIESMPEVVEKLGDKSMMDAQQESHIRLQMATDMFTRPEAWSPPVKKSRNPDDLFIFQRV